MTLPNIDFKKIRPHHGSQNLGFEELCCQLAALEEVPQKEKFYRKGPGGDAGVECYATLKDGFEIGWQAKYFFDFESTQLQQLNDSILTALTKHPKLSKYIVCLPIDLRDSRADNSKSKTQLARWQDWVSKWELKASSLGRSITLELWSLSSITERLVRDNPLYTGRLLYWFDEVSFS